MSFASSSICLLNWLTLFSVCFFLSIVDVWGLKSCLSDVSDKFLNRFGVLPCLSVILSSLFFIVIEIVID